MPSTRVLKPHESHKSLYPFLTPGVKIIFRVGLVLLRNTLGSVDKLRSCQGMYETMEKLRNLPAQCMQEDFLVHEVSLTQTALSRGLASSECGGETTMSQPGALPVVGAGPW